MVASPSRVPFEARAATRMWLLDLTLNPAMSPPLLGHTVADAIQVTAAEREAAVTCNFWHLPSTVGLTDALDSLSLVLVDRLGEHSEELRHIRDIVWSSATDDSFSIDIADFVTTLVGDDLISLDADLVRAAGLVHEAAEVAVPLTVTTLEGDDRQGLMICFPEQIEDINAVEYSQLRFASEASGWPQFLTAYGTQEPRREVHVNGSVMRLGTELQDIFLMLNDSEAGLPHIVVENPVQLVATGRPDSVGFNVTVDLGRDSLSCYVGLFQDLDASGSFTTGDRYGWVRTPPFVADWLTLQAGDTLGPVFVNLNRQ